MFGVIKQLRKAIASRHDEMAELTASLVAIDTENPPGRNFERCLRFLGEKLACNWEEESPFMSSPMKKPAARSCLSFLRGARASGHRALLARVVPCDSSRTIQP